MGAARGDFRLLVAASAVSGVGDWLFNVGLVTYVWTQTHSLAWLAAVEIVAFAGNALFAALGGALADRVDLRRLLVATDLACAATMGALALIASQDAGIWAASAAVLVLAAVSGPQVPAVVAITPRLVREDRLPRANALLSGAEHLALAVGPALGALALVLGSPSATFLANGATFVVSALLITRIRGRYASLTEAVAPMWARTRTSLAAVRESRLTMMLAFWIVVGVLFGMEGVLVPVVAERLLGIGIEGYGWLLAAAGVGGLAAIPLSSRLRPGATMTTAGIALLLIAVPFALLAVVREPLLGCVIWAVAGAGTLLGSVVHDTAVQRRITPGLIGGVAGTFEALYVLGIVAGALLAPLLVSLVGLEASLWVTGAVVSAAALAALPALRALDALPADQALRSSRSSSPTNAALK